MPTRAAKKVTTMAPPMMVSARLAANVRCSNCCSTAVPADGFIVFSFLSLLNGALKRRLRTHRRHRNDRANDEVEEPPCRAPHHREETHRHKKPCAAPPLLAIEIDPAPDKQV